MSNASDLFKHSLIEQSIVELGQSSNASRAALSALVLKQDGENILNQLAGTFVALRRQRRDLERLDALDNGRRAKDMIAKPEHMLTFLQATMNKICWMARSLYLKSREQEQDDRLNGIDYTADRMEELGLEPCSTGHIGEHVEQDFAWLLNVHTVMASRMSYLKNLEDFYLYADRAPVPEDELAQDMEVQPWELRASAHTFDEALVIMDRVLDELAERELEAEYAVAHMDYTMAA